MMEKRIAVVNFDMIMCNVIRVYQPLVDIKGYPGECWNRIHKELKLRPMVDLRYDSNILQFLNKFLLKTVKNGAEIRCVDNITECEDLFDLSNATTYNITNLGFFSGLKRDTDATILDKYNIGNWAYYLITNGKVKLDDYGWVKCINSDVSDYLYTRSAGKFFKTIATFKPKGKYDEVIFVFSPLFVPEEYRHIYELIIDSIEILTGKNCRGCNS